MSDEHNADRHGDVYDHGPICDHCGLEAAADCCDADPWRRLATALEATMQRAITVGKLLRERKAREFQAKAHAFINREKR